MPAERPTPEEVASTAQPQSEAADPHQDLDPVSAADTTAEAPTAEHPDSENEQVAPTEALNEEQLLQKMYDLMAQEDSSMVSRISNGLGKYSLTASEILNGAWFYAPDSHLAHELLEVYVDNQLAADNPYGAANALMSHPLTEQALKEKYNEQFILGLYEKVMSRHEFDDAYEMVLKIIDRSEPEEETDAEQQPSPSDTEAGAVDWRAILGETMRQWAVYSLQQYRQHTGNDGNDLARIYDYMKTYDIYHPEIMTRDKASILAQDVARALIARALEYNHIDKAQELARGAHLPDGYVDQQIQRMNQEWREQHPSIPRRIANKVSSRIRHSASDKNSVS